MQTENEAYVVLLCSHLGDMIYKLQAIPAENWDWTPALPAPSARMVAEHAWVWLVTDRQHLEQPDITQHKQVPAPSSDPATFCAALQAERDWWRATLPTLTPEQLLEERFQFGVGPMNVRSLIVHITQQTIYKNGQLAMLFFALGLDGEEVYTAPHPNTYYTDLSRMLESPLHSAVLQDDIATLKTELTQENAVEAATVANHTPLQIAVMRNRPEIVSLLLAAGADGNVTDEEGNTPLLYAAVFGFLPIVEALIRSGVDLHKSNNWGNTPLQLARARKRTEIVALLEAAGATHVESGREEYSECTTEAEPGAVPGL